MIDKQGFNVNVARLEDRFNNSFFEIQGEKAKKWLGYDCFGWRDSSKPFTQFEADRVEIGYELKFHGSNADGALSRETMNTSLEQEAGIIVGRTYIVTDIDKTKITESKLDFYG